MRIKHIYINKEGELMANPYMEYPKRHTDCPKQYPDFSDECVRLEDGRKFCKCRDYERILQRYHSGLMRFEDRLKIIGLLPVSCLKITTDDDGREIVKITPDTLIPVDLEVEVVGQFKVRDGWEDMIPSIVGTYDFNNNPKLRKVLRIKP